MALLPKGYQPDPQIVLKGTCQGCGWKDETIYNRDRRTAEKVLNQRHKKAHPLCPGSVDV